MDSSDGSTANQMLVSQEDEEPDQDAIYMALAIPPTQAASDGDTDIQTTEPTDGAMLQYV